MGIHARVLPYYELKIYLDPTIVDNMTQQKYDKMVRTNQSKYDAWRSLRTQQCIPELDAGIDLYTPQNHTIGASELSHKTNMGIKCSMTFYQPGIQAPLPCGYFLYPRSSTGAKTSLRLSNSVGVIDAGYRGFIIALFDNVSDKSYSIQGGDRVVQICSPNITYPIIPILVSNETDIENYFTMQEGENPLEPPASRKHPIRRGTDGFGSTGT